MTDFATAAQKISAGVFESNGAGGLYSAAIGTLEGIIDNLLADIHGLKDSFTAGALGRLDADRGAALDTVHWLVDQIEAAATTPFVATIQSVSQELLDAAGALDAGDPYSQAKEHFSEALEALQELPEKAVEYGEKTAEAAEKIKAYNECVDKHKKDASERNRLVGGHTSPGRCPGRSTAGASPRWRESARIPARRGFRPSHHLHSRRVRYGLNQIVSV